MPTNTHTFGELAISMVLGLAIGGAAVFGFAYHFGYDAGIQAAMATTQANQ